MSESSTDNPFPIRLKEARDLRELSQVELAGRAGLQPSAVSHFETGGRKPSFNNLMLLADALQVTTDYLLGRTDVISAPIVKGNPFFADFARLSSANQEVAKNVVKTLIKNQGSDKK